MHWTGHHADWASSGRPFETWASRRRRGFGSGRRRGPLAIQILLAGIAVFALTRLMSASNRPHRTGAEKALLAVLMAAAAGFILTLRRSAARYRV
jgi:hypothetical protein